MDIIVVGMTPNLKDQLAEVLKETAKDQDIIILDDISNIDDSVAKSSLIKSIVQPTIYIEEPINFSKKIRNEKKEYRNRSKHHSKYIKK